MMEGARRAEPNQKSNSKEQKYISKTKNFFSWHGVPFLEILETAVEAILRFT